MAFGLIARPARNASEGSASWRAAVWGREGDSRRDPLAVARCEVRGGDPEAGQVAMVVDQLRHPVGVKQRARQVGGEVAQLRRDRGHIDQTCLLYTSDAADERSSVDLG